MVDPINQSSGTASSFPNSDDLAAKKLPKPVTMTGSALTPPVEDTPEIEEEVALDPDDSDGDEVEQETLTASNGTDLPTPVVFGDEDEDSLTPKATTPTPMPDPESTTEAVAPSPDPIIGRPVVETIPTEEESPFPDTDLPSAGALSSLSSETAQDLAFSATPQLSTPDSDPTQNQSPLPTSDLGAAQPSTPMMSSPFQDSGTPVPSPVYPSVEPLEQPSTQPVSGYQQGVDFSIPALNQTPTTTPMTFSPAPSPAAAMDQVILNHPMTPIQADQIPADHIQNVVAVPEMEPSGSEPSRPETPRTKSALAKATMGMMAVLVGGSVVVGGYFASRQFLGNQEQSPTQAVVEQQPVVTTTKTLQPVPTAVPTLAPTPEPEIDKATLRVKILNGSGIKGEAGRVKTVLEKAGYKDVATGNADSFDHPKTTIDYKTEFESFLEVITKDLKAYQAVAGSELEKKDEFDFYIILGNSATKVAEDKVSEEEESEDSPSTEEEETAEPSATPSVQE